MARNAGKLAAGGGTPLVTEKPQPLVRWDDKERRQLAAMIDQPALFYWNGPQTKLLTKRFQEHYPLKHVMPCSSGTASIHIAIAAAGIAPGDEVITAPISDMGSIIGLLYQQGVPVFADLLPSSYTLDPADVERKVTKKTRAVLAVHLTGNPCRMAELKRICARHKLVLIEDCAQAWGAEYRGKPVGTIGDIGCFSLNDFKHIGCGDGGIVASNNPKFGPVLQKFGDKAYDRVGGGRDVDVLAPNYRISEPQSAVAAVQMTRLESIARKRQALGDLLTELIADVPGIMPHKVDPKDRCSYWFYWFRVQPEKLTCDRDQFAAALAAEGVICWGGYATSPLYRRPAMLNANFFAGRWPIRELGLTKMDYNKVRCPVAEAICQTAIHTTIRQNMTTKYIRQTAQAIRKVAEQYGK
jgi:perosamine synthetase